MHRELEKIRKNFEKKIKTALSTKDLKQIRQDFLGKKGVLKKILDLLKNLNKDKRKEIGKRTNELKDYIKKSIQEKKEEFLSVRQAPEKQVDVSLPGKKIPQGSLHPLTQTLMGVKRAFESMGFSVFLTPEVETEFYNFDALNIPDNHPARDMWDTFWLKNNQLTSDESQANQYQFNRSGEAGVSAKGENQSPASENLQKLLLRTHTSAMQLRYMKEHNPPFRIITPGKCFRYEASDSSHDIQFYQVDGVVVDKNISVTNFKAVIEELLKRLFFSSIKTRFRPGYFPFVEPGFEIDIGAYGAKKSSQGDETNWLEIMGAGMIHPAVFRQAGYNPLHWQGFAFGMGIDRIAMLKYGISDIRVFYQNDLRFLKQF